MLLGTLGLLWPPRRRAAFAGASGALMALLVSAIPFARVVARRDPGVLAWAPVFVLARAAAFTAGVLGSVLAMLEFPSGQERPRETGT